MAAIVAAALIAVGVEVGALVTLALVTALFCGLMAYEAIRFRETRERVRARVRTRAATTPRRSPSGSS